MQQVTNEMLAEQTRGQTVPSRFLETVRSRPDAVALRARDGDGWQETTFAEYAEDACRVAAGLGELGVRRGDRVVLMMRNRPEFFVADMAALLVGATPISIYNSSAPEQVQYLVGHCEAKVAIVEDVDFLERFLKVRSELPALEHIVLMEDPEGVAPDDVGSWEGMLALDPVDVEAASRIVQPSDLATVIYTSGTTGPPKGVMLDHANVCWTAESLRLTLAHVAAEGRRLVSYLPMAHIAERMTSYYQQALLGYEVTTCPEAREIASYLPQVRPEIMFAVPRIWEKVYAGVQAVIAADPAQKALFERALEAGDDSVLRPVRELLGLDQVIAAITGAAPIPVEILEFFRALGVPLAEIYGMSESSGPMTFDAVEVRIGTVGRAIPGCEVKLAEDGEVICRGGNVFRGYLSDPAKTADALDAAGWLHSGDIGEMDEDGYLRIVDRKKELIITAGGKNISPANLESALKAFPLIGQACVIGDRRPFVTALLVLDPEISPTWAKRRGVDDMTLSELAEHAEVRAEVERNVAEANKRFNNVEQVKRFALLGDEWLPDSEELTPTMKLKRRGIYTKYAEVIEELYGTR
ncbi:MAG TPA: AMP-dependent synthetase/ligase [Acidimicrobiia bacterium]|nr:AMP-dependent synthetase/ligase [Acidimicrobiia bacterium]